MKKTIIIQTTVTILCICITFMLFGQSAGDYRTRADGEWRKSNPWQIYNGSNWVNASNYPDDPDATVTIRNGHTIEMNANHPDVLTVIVESGAKLFRDQQASRRYLHVYGDVICNGIIGNGPNTDALVLYPEGAICNILGSGECKFFEIKKTSSDNSITTLNILMDLEIYRTNQYAISNSANNTMLNIVVWPGIDVTTHTDIDLDDCTLDLKADQTGAAASLICPEVDNSDAANTNVQRYIEEDMWHYISSPVDDINSGVFLSMYLKWFYEPDSVWTYIFNPDSLLTTDMQGYALWAASWLTGSKIVDMKGALNYGAKDIDLTFTAGAPHNSKGFNFVGNPYPSAIDWNNNSGWTLTNVDASIHLWNPAVGNYGVYVKNAPGGTNGVDNIIPAHQGFFVHCNAATGNLEVDHPAQVHDDKPFFKDGKAFPKHFYLLTVSGNDYSDQTIVRFDPDATAGYDHDLDAYKFFGLYAAPQIYTFSAEKYKLSVNTKRPDDAAVTPIGFEFGEEGLYSLSIDPQSLMPGVVVYLHDRKENITHNFSEVSKYDFLAENGDPEVRFALYFVVDKPPAFKSSGTSDEMHVYSHAENIYISNPGSLHGQIGVYDLSGRLVSSEDLMGDLLQVMNPNVQSGYYMVVVKTETGAEAHKLFIQ